MVAHYLSWAFWVQPESRGNIKRSALGESLLLEDARVETANLKGKIIIMLNTGSLSLLSLE